MSCQGLGKISEAKCKDILELYPNCKISLLLPTKIDSLNYRVKELNNVLRDIIKKHYVTLLIIP